MNNNIITQESFNGPLTAIFFGFTNCPDICPMTLNKMDIVMNRIKKNKKKDLKVFFISVDPKSCLLYTSPSPRDLRASRMPSSA